LGAAANAMATIQAVEDMDPAERQRKLLLVSFENDLDSLKLAMRSQPLVQASAARRTHSAAQRNRWTNSSGSIDWLLLGRRFRATEIDAPAPDIRVLRSVSRSRRMRAVDTGLLP